MKRIVSLTTMFITGGLILILMGCGGSDAEIKNQEKDVNYSSLGVMNSADSLIASYYPDCVNMEIDSQFVEMIPDSLKDKMAEWIKETVRAASFKVSGGDYEDPEDVVKRVSKEAEKLYTRNILVTGLGFEVRSDSGPIYYFVPYHKLTSPGKKIFHLLEKRH